MQYCTACQKAIATIVVMDLTEGTVSGSQHVCAACAEQLGVTPPKQPKFSNEMLEDLLDGLQESIEPAPAAAPTAPLDSCPGCSMSPETFRQKGRLGCPRCYGAFRDELMPLLHDTTEIFYRFDIADNLAITASAQWLHNPALNPTADNIGVFGIRTRFNL